MSPWLGCTPWKDAPGLTVTGLFSSVHSTAFVEKWLKGDSRIGNVLRGYSSGLSQILNPRIQ